MGLFDEETPKRAMPNVQHVAEDLSRLSENDLTKRIEQLREEIARTEAELQKRSNIRSDADALFRS